MPEKLVGGYTLNDAERWAGNLTTAITSGIYQYIAPGWLDSTDLVDPVSTTLAWAEEANAFVCTAVFPDGVDAIDGQEL